MPKIVHLADDGSYLGLVDRGENVVGARQRAQAASTSVSDAAAPPEPSTPSADAVTAEAPVGDLSYHELRALAKQLGMTGYSHMKKDELAAAVEAARG